MSDDLSTRESRGVCTYSVSWYWLSLPPGLDGNELGLHRSCEVYSVEGESCCFVVVLL